MSYTSTTIKRLRYLINRDNDQLLVLEKNNGAFDIVALDTPAARDAAVSAAVNDLLAGVPGALATLNELATALGDDPNFATTITTALGNRLAWKGNWAATTNYVRNDIVLFNGGLYAAPNSFTSGLTFHKTSWTELVPQSNAYISTKGPFFFPESYGGIGDGVADDSVAVQGAFTDASNWPTGGTVIITKPFRVTRNLYLWGTTDVWGQRAPGSSTSGLILDGDLSLSDGIDFWINFGIQTKGGTKTTWHGHFRNVSLYASATAVCTRMLGLHVGRDCWVEDCFVDITANGSTSTMGFIGFYNNSAWCTGAVRQRIHVVGNAGQAAQNAANGSEFIGIGNAQYVWVHDNYCTGFGDDAIGLHQVDYFRVRDNLAFSADGRIFMGGCRHGKVYDNHVERIVDQSGAWINTGYDLIACTIESATHPAPADIDIHDNTLIHGQQTSGTFNYGIHLSGTRRVKVHDNTIHDTSGFGYAVTWQGRQVAGWVDNETLDSIGNARTHELDVTNNKVTGTGANGLIAEQQAFVGDMIGPATVAGNDTPGTVSLSTMSAYRAFRTPFSPTHFGDGVDGAIAFDGTTTITLNGGITIVPVANVYTLPRSIFPTTCVVNNGVIVKTGRFQIIASTSVINNGTVSDVGNDAASATAGAALGNGVFTGSGGGGGGVATLATGAAGTVTTAGFEGSHAGAGGGGGGSGTTGVGSPGAITAANGWVTRTGGTGGNAGTSGATGGAGGNASVSNNPAEMHSSIGLALGAGFTRNGVSGLCGAAGGGAGAGDGANAGGGGGGGGGVVFIVAPTIINNGTFSVKGGAGGNAAGGNAGGGGGGGGGAITLVGQTIITGTTDVTGGAGGNAAGAGTGGHQGGSGLLQSSIVA